MKKEIAYTLSKQFRLIENNFWFSVEKYTFRGWKPSYKTRDRDSAVAVLEMCNVETAQ